MYDFDKITQFLEEAYAPIEFVPKSQEQPKEKPANLSTGKSSHSSEEFRVCHQLKVKFKLFQSVMVHKSMKIILIFQNTFNML